MTVAVRAALAANDGLIVALGLIVGGFVVLLVFAVLLKAAGAPLRPLVFIGSLFLPVALVFLVGQLVMARASSMQPAEGLTVEAGRFVASDEIFGPDIPVEFIRDARGALPGILDGAEAAAAGVAGDGSSVLVARFADEATARLAAAAYHRAFGLTETGGDEKRGWTAHRMQGDYVEILVSGPCLFVWSGLTKAARTARREATTAVRVASEAAPLFPSLLPLAEFFAPLPMKLGGLVFGVLIYSVWFFQGAAWAARVPGQSGAPPVSEPELTERLTALNDLNLPFTVARGSAPEELVVDWRYADSKWIDAAAVRGIRRTFRLRLILDKASHAVRATDYMAALDWSAGKAGANLEWRMASGVVFFHREAQATLGITFDDKGHLKLAAGHAWRFDLGEMKSPLVALVTKSGWSWNPTIWRMPSWLRRSR